jgi:hypothetical protein
VNYRYCRNCEDGNFTARGSNRDRWQMQQLPQAGGPI